MADFYAKDDIVTVDASHIYHAAANSKVVN